MTSFLNHQAIPALCIPITGRTKATINEQLKHLLNEQADMIEWRADFFEQLADVEEVLEVIRAIKSQTKLPLLFTIRAAHEGGEAIALTEAEKVTLLERVCFGSQVNAVDYELVNKAQDVARVQQAAQMNGKKYIASFHNFKQTPSAETLIKKGEIAEQAGADIVKFAVMPQVKADVFRLLHATELLNNRLSIPVVTMSMGELGAISRVIGWTFGSVITFGTAAAASAPGQPPAGKLKKAIKEVQAIAPIWQEL